jgi:tetratricopeptide (TPR) repeat protein
MTELRFSASRDVATTMNLKYTSQILSDAITAHNASRFAEAELLYREFLVIEPQNFRCLRLLGLLYGQTRQIAPGLETFRRALEIRPDWTEGHASVGELLRLDGQDDAAAKAFETALRLDPHLHAVHNSLGLLHLERDRLSDAASCFRAAIALKSDSANAWNNLGLTLQKARQADEAAAAFRKALAIAPDRTDFLANLGTLFFDQDDLPRAMEHYRAALEVDPDFVPALKGLARCQAEIDENEALATIEKGLRQAPQDADLYGLLGSVRQQQGHFDAAFQAYRTATRLPAASYASYYGMARCRKFTAADYDLVLSMKSALDHPELRRKDRASLHFALGKVLDDMGRCGEAILHIDEANRLSKSAAPYDRKMLALKIDAMIDYFDAQGIDRLRASGCSSEKPIFIVGMMRSGTTLVEQILASHPDVAAGGELSFWGNRVKTLKVGLDGKLDSAYFAGDYAQNTVRDYLATLERVSPDAPRVTDKMPHNFMVLGIIHALFPNARIVHCRRNAIDTCLSIYSTLFAKPLEFAYDRGDLVAFYKEYKRQMAHWRAVLPVDRFLEADYEQLVGDTAAVSRRLVEFCGLEWNERCLNFSETERSIRTASSWQARQPIYQSSAQRWRRYEPWLGEFRELLDTEQAGDKAPQGLVRG